jgi:hypothetical protein
VEPGPDCPRDVLTGALLSSIRQAFNQGVESPRHRTLYRSVRGLSVAPVSNLVRSGFRSRPVAVRRSASTTGTMDGTYYKSAGSDRTCDLHRNAPLETTANRLVPMACGPNVDHARCAHPRWRRAPQRIGVIHKEVTRRPHSNVGSMSIRSR